MTFANLSSARYVSLRTYKKDGSAVDLPVWVVGDSNELFVYTLASSYKVKRLQRNSNCQLAICNLTGRRIRSGWTDGVCTIDDSRATADMVLGLLRKKYGIFGWFGYIKAKLLPKHKAAITVIRIRPQ